MSKKETGSLFSAIYALVFKIPPGHVTTYGQIARAVGCTARTVGFAMAALPSGSDVPWQRVINAQGKISPR
ncbi:MAG: methyltransferase, partial [Deltaproteobacteria bacterium]